MKEILAFLALSSVKAVRVDASQVCVTNYLNETISWYVEDEFFLQQSIKQDQGSATTTCKEIGTYVFGATTGTGYDMFSFYGNATLTEKDWGAPFMIYEPTAGSANYICGSAGDLGYCCCLLGTTAFADICYWDGDKTYTSCETPAHITTPV